MSTRSSSQVVRSTAKNYLSEKQGAFAHLRPRSLALKGTYAAALWGEGWLGTYLAVERCRDARYELEDTLLAREQEAGEEFLRRVEVLPHEEFDHVQFMVEHSWDVATAVADFTANQLGSSQLLGASIMGGIGSSGSGRGSGVGSEQGDVTGSGSIAGSDVGGTDWSSLIAESQRAVDECAMELVAAEEKHASTVERCLTGERYLTLLGKAVSVTSCVRLLEHGVLAGWGWGATAGSGAVRDAVTREHLLSKLCKNVASSARRKYARCGSRLATANRIFSTSLRADALTCTCAAFVDQVHTTVAPAGRRRPGLAGYAAATVYHTFRCAVSLAMAACGASVGSALWPGHGTAVGQLAFSVLVDPLVDKVCADFRRALNLPPIASK